jgi:uncharacterized protein YkwD
MEPRRRVVCILLAILAAATIAAEPPALELSDGEKAVCELTNTERARAGLPALTPDATLFAAARSHSANMARQNKLSHKLDGKEVDDRVEAAGYNYMFVGENVAWNQDSPAKAMQSWMNSSGHRANILNKDYTQLGVGIARNRDGEPYYTQVFGRPRTIRAAIPPPLAGGAGGRAEPPAVSSPLAGGERGRAEPPAASLAGGAGGRAETPATISFRISNDADRTAKITLPLSKKTTDLERREEGTYSFSGFEELPPVKLRIGKATFELLPANGARYVIKREDGEYQVYREQPVTTQ